MSHFEIKQIERKVFEKTKAAPILIGMRKAGRQRAKLQKFAFRMMNKLSSAVTGQQIERHIQRGIFTNINFMMLVKLS